MKNTSKPHSKKNSGIQPCKMAMKITTHMPQQNKINAHKWTFIP